MTSVMVVFSPLSDCEDRFSMANTAGVCCPWVRIGLPSVPPTVKAPLTQQLSRQQQQLAQ
jgi:hypothetical protein